MTSMSYEDRLKRFEEEHDALLIRITSVSIPELREQLTEEYTELVDKINNLKSSSTETYNANQTYHANPPGESHREEKRVKKVIPCSVIDILINLGIDKNFINKTIAANRVRIPLDRRTFADFCKLLRVSVIIKDTNDMTLEMITGATNAAKANTNTSANEYRDELFEVYFDKK